MQFILVAAAVFGLCFLIDKGFTKAFRGTAQHRSGLAVKVSKYYATIGIILVILGIAALFMDLEGGDLLLTAGGASVIVVGLCLIMHYVTFGVYYDDDGFVVSKFGKRSVTYRYNQISTQQLYASGGTTVIELYLNDGTTLMLQSNLDGTYAFLDHAFKRWCIQKGIAPETCDFHDPQNSLWFPATEDV